MTQKQCEFHIKTKCIHGQNWKDKTRESEDANAEWRCHNCMKKSCNDMKSECEMTNEKMQSANDAMEMTDAIITERELQPKWEMYSFRQLLTMITEYLQYIYSCFGQINVHMSIKNALIMCVMLLY